MSNKEAEKSELRGAETPHDFDSEVVKDFTSCALCKKEKFSFDQVIARWTYEGRVCDAIIAAKFARHAALGDAIGRLLGERVVSTLANDPPEIVTMVPSAFRRRLSRGGRSGNLAITQAIVKSIRQTGANSSLKFMLKSTRSVKKQALLSDKERRANVAGAFAVKKGYAWPKTPGLTNPHILLVDDVVTTGATANEAARVLREAGAGRVTLAVVARAVWS